MIPECTRDDILNAMKIFDAEKRNDKRWIGWENKRQHCWAIAYETKMYPVKEIIRMATGGKSPSGGKAANKYAGKRGFEIARLQEDEGADMQNQFWIFQANPKHFDLPGALGKLDEVAFAANQKSELMQSGDTVFFWESGPSGGLLGTGEIIDGPKIMKNPEKENLFKKSNELPDETLRVIVTVDNVLSKRIPRDDLNNHPILKTISFFKMAQGTNFRLTQVAGYSLLAAIDGHLNPNIYKVIPGPRKIFWADCLKEDFICAGWDGTDDLSGYESQKSFREHFDEVFQNDTQKKQNMQANMLWIFKNLAPGDILVASSGGKELLALGIVQESGYKFLSSRPKYKHTVAVLWDTSYARIFPTIVFSRRTINNFGEEKLAEMISEKMPQPPPVKGVFTDLMKSLSDAGYYFSEEVVANYLLALQTKRFVIFSGISGTGKTQLAMLAAKHFERTKKTKKSIKLYDDATKIEVTRDAIIRTRFHVPVSLSKSIKFPPKQEGKPRRIEVVYPKGKQFLTTYTNPDRPGLLIVLFRNKSRDWFKENFSVGDHFFIRTIEANKDEDPDSLEILLPIIEEREEKLNNSLVVSVRPDWTDNRGLLGYYNPLIKQYVSTPLIDFIFQAQENSDYAFFLILDEMNLARVEHYFSDFLSCLESDTSIHLHDDEAIEEGDGQEGKAIPRYLNIPDNLFITGTVNVDETTYMFSPKVLDRAFTIELSEVDFEAAATGIKGSPPAGGFRLDGMKEVIRWERKPHSGDWKGLTEIDNAFPSGITDLNSILGKYNRHFGYRVAWEIARFVCLANEQCSSGESAISDAMDLAILQKVLPKFHGTQNELEKPLLYLFAFCITGSVVTDAGAENVKPKSWKIHSRTLICNIPQDDASLDEPVYPRSATKLWRMLDRLARQGFASFID